MRAKFLLIGLAFFTVIAYNYTIFGQCSCAFVSPDSEYVEIIFTGKILSESKGRKYKIQVTEKFKGLKDEKTVEAQEGFCNSGREIDKEYLFMAVRDKETGEIKIVACSHSYKNIDKQRQFIEILRWKKKANNEGGILVGIVGGNYEKEDGLNVVYVESETGEKYEAKIGEDGFYKLENLKPGRYKVFLKLPETLITYGDREGYDWLKSIRYLNVLNNEGTISDFIVLINGIISGKVFDENKNPVGKIEVNLYSFDDKEKEYISNVVETDEEGNYTFKGVSAGKHFIKIGIDRRYFNPAETNVAFPNTYFPNQTSRSKAEIIDLGKARILKDKNIFLTKLAKRAVKGQITFEDGTPAANASISVILKRQIEEEELQSYSLYLGETDSDGNFKFDAFEDTKYLVRVYISKKTRPSEAEILFSADCFVISKTGQINPLKIVLKKGDTECKQEFTF